MVQHVLGKNSGQQAQSTAPSESSSSPTRIRDRDSTPAIHAFELEARVLYSAAPFPADILADVPEVVGEPMEALNPTEVLDFATPSAIEASYDILDEQSTGLVLEFSEPATIFFVDAGVENFETLVADIEGQNSDVIVAVIDAERDGIDQVSRILNLQGNVGAVHILSHGSDGQIQLGGTSLSASTLDGYAERIAAWRPALNDAADIFLYGCDVAGTSSGTALIDSLALLTGADIAASDDRTGDVELQGDWELEYSSGELESSALTLNADADWSGTLNLTEEGEFRVNDISANDQTTAALNHGSEQAVSLADDGTYVVVWASDEQDGDGWGVFARRFDASGEPLTADIAVNSITAGDQQFSRVVSAGDGSFIVTWTDGVVGDEDVYFRRFDAAGTPLGIEVLASDTLTGSQSNSVIAQDSTTGDFVIAWQGEGPGDSDGVFFRRFDADGTAKDMTDMTATLNNMGDPQFDPVIAMRSSGDFVIAWDDGVQVFQQRFHADGSNDGARERIDSLVSNTSQLAVASNESGDYTFAFVQEPGIGSGIWIRGYHADGSDKFFWRLVEGGNSAQDPSISIAADGTHVVTWTDTDADGTGVFAQRLDDAGNHLGNEEMVSVSTIGDQARASVAMIDTDHFVVIWSGQGDQASEGDQHGTGIFGRQFGDSNDAPTSDAGGPYSIEEGESLVLDGSASSDPEGASLTFAWDLNNDQVYGDVIGMAPVVDWATLRSFGIDDDGSALVIGLQVTDDAAQSSIATTTLVVSNAAPTITIDGAASIDEGGLYTLNLATSDDGNDTIDRWRINWGDGTIETVLGSVSTATHVYTGAGQTFDITVSVTDEDGTFFQNELLVTDYGTGNSIFRYGSQSGDFLQEFATSDGLSNPIEVIVGPDGFLYVSGEQSDNVLRYDATTGAFVDEFVTAGSGGLDVAGGLAFGMDGHLYVASDGTDEVLRFDGTTGAFIDAFVAAGSGGLDQPYSLVFGQDGNLYVSSYNNDEVLRYDGTSGDFVDTFVVSDSGGLDLPEQMVFGPDGHLYVASFGSNEVLRYDGTTGAFLDVFVPAGRGGLDRPSGIAFGPDGNLYVSDFRDDAILRFDGNTGSFIDEYVAPGSNGLDAPNFITFLPQHQVHITDVNAAPELIDTTVMLNTVVEDAGLPFGQVGTPINSIVGLNGAAEGPGNVIDDDNLPSTGIAITAVDTTHGTWHFSTDNGTTWTVVGSVSETAALVLASDANTRIHFQGNPDYEGSILHALSFRAWDQSDGIVNGTAGVDTTANGGTSSFSIATETAAITVTAVNDAPTVEAALVATANQDDAVFLMDLLEHASDVDLGDSLHVVSLSLIRGDDGGITVLENELSVDPSYYDYLAESETEVVVYHFEIVDLHGGRTAQSAKITISGTNDGPSLENSIMVATTQDGPTLEIDLLEGAEDPDLSEQLTTRNLVLVDGDDGGVTVVNGRLIVDPSFYNTLQADENERIAYTYEVVDSLGSAVSQTATIVVAGSNDDPFVRTPLERWTAREDDANTRIDLSDVFADVDNAVLRYSVVDHGSSVVVDAAVIEHRLVLDYQANQFGETSITVRATDSAGQFVDDTIIVTVEAVNDAPQVVNRKFDNSNNAPVITGNLLAGSFDIENDPLTATLLTSPVNGDITLKSDGSFVFQPAPGFVGTITLEFVAFDGDRFSDTGTATIVVTAPAPPTPPPTVDNSTEEEDGDEELLLPIGTLPVVNSTTPIKDEATTFARDDSIVVAAKSTDEEGEDVQVVYEEVNESSVFRLIPTMVSDTSVGTVSSAHRGGIDSLNSAPLLVSLEQFGGDLDSAVEAIQFEQLSTVVSLSGVSVGVVTWMLRSGAVMASMMVNLPAWRMVDPLVVLGYSHDSDEDSESLLDIVEDHSGSESIVDVVQFEDVPLSFDPTQLKG